MINPDICSCCGEIWNRENLKHIPLGKHELRLCPECYTEYIKPFMAVKAEIKGHADRPKDSLYGDGMRHCLKLLNSIQYKEMQCAMKNNSDWFGRL